MNDIKAIYVGPVQLDIMSPTGPLSHFLDPAEYGWPEDRGASWWGE